MIMHPSNYVWANMAVNVLSVVCEDIHFEENYDTFKPIYELRKDSIFDIRNKHFTYKYKLEDNITLQLFKYLYISNIQAVSSIQNNSDTQLLQSLQLRRATQCLSAVKTLICMLGTEP